MRAYGRELRTFQEEVEHADAFTKKPGKDQLRVLYIVEYGLGEAENAVELANAAMNGAKFRWDRLSGAVDLVEEENIKSAEPENGIRDMLEPDMENPERAAKIRKIAEENHVTEKGTGHCVLFVSILML